MKILLIEPNRYYYKGSKDIRLSLPLGLLYVASNLRKEIPDIQLEIFDCQISDCTEITEQGNSVLHGVNEQNFKARLSQYKPDLVGISCMFTAQAEGTYEAAKWVREVFPEMFVVAGGAHFSTTDETLLKTNRDIDCFVTGEGEAPMVEIVKAVVAEKSLEGIDGLTFKYTDEQGNVVTQKNAHRAEREMDDLPMPAYDLIDMDLFFEYQRTGLSARSDTGMRTISMITSRGCPFRCTFCSIALHMGKPVRDHGADYVVDHIEHVVNKYGVEHIFFEDDALTFRPDRMKTICEELIRKRIKFTWSTPNGVRADTLSPELLKVMQETGCTGLIVGTESGNQDTLTNIVKKDLKLTTIVQVAKWCKELKIPLSQFLIIGFPGETHETMMDTVNFAVKLYDEYDVKPMLNIATPLLGTELHKVVMENNYLEKAITPQALSSATQAGKGESLISTKDFSPSDLIDLAGLMKDRIRRVRVRKALTRPSEYAVLFKTLTHKPDKVFNLVRKLLKVA